MATTIEGLPPEMARLYAVAGRRESPAGRPAERD